MAAPSDLVEGNDTIIYVDSKRQTLLGFMTSTYPSPPNPSTLEPLDDDEKHMSPSGHPTKTPYPSYSNQSHSSILHPTPTLIYPSLTTQSMQSAQTKQPFLQYQRRISAPNNTQDNQEGWANSYSEQSVSVSAPRSASDSISSRHQSIDSKISNSHPDQIIVEIDTPDFANLSNQSNDDTKSDNMNVPNETNQILQPPGPWRQCRNDLALGMCVLLLLIFVSLAAVLTVLSIQRII